VPLPQRVFAFADTLIDLGAALPFNNALLDPPWLFQGKGEWTENTCPTTSFRHAGRCVSAFVDGHVEARGPNGGKITSLQHMIGSVGAANDPHYVPVWP
jgi:prepilin-type processing-associated H-X9-DG protein